jgi:hypothetical protein
VGYSGAVEDAFVWFVIWIVLSLVGLAFPLGLGALIPIAGILVAIDDLENTTTGTAIVGALVTWLLATAINDQPASTLYGLAVLLGILSVFGKGTRGGL